MDESWEDLEFEEALAQLEEIVTELEQGELSLEEAVEKLAAIYAKAGAGDKFVGRFYDHPHLFSKKMQEEAFDWLDRWLTP